MRVFNKKNILLRSRWPTLKVEAVKVNNKSDSMDPYEAEGRWMWMKIRLMKIVLGGCKPKNHLA